jgi:hypothetical protein
MSRKPQPGTDVPPVLRGAAHDRNPESVTFALGALVHFGDDDRHGLPRWGRVGRWLRRWHFCPLDADCRRFGLCWRIYYFGKRYSYMLALAPGDRFVANGPIYPDEVRDTILAAMRSDPRLFFADLASRRTHWFVREPRDITEEQWGPA